MMRIGIDIDGVLTNVEQFSIDYFSKYCFENNIEYNIGESHYNYDFYTLNGNKLFVFHLYI